MIAMILIRNLHRDIMRYNRVPTDEEKAEEREETGWKVSAPLDETLNMLRRSQVGMMNSFFSFADYVLIFRRSVRASILDRFLGVADDIYQYSWHDFVTDVHLSSLLL